MEEQETNTIAELKKEIDRLKEMVHLRESQMNFNKLELEMALRREAERYNDLLQIYWKVDEDKDHFRNLSETLQIQVKELSEQLQEMANRDNMIGLQKAE